MTKIVSKKEIKIDVGNPYLFGANIRHNGCNFALFSKNASSVSLLLFDDFEDSEPATIIELDKEIHKTGDVWHIFIYGITHGQYYGYIVDGPYWPVNKGHRFNVNKLLVDPYAKAVCGRYNWTDKASFGYDVGSKLKDISYNKSKNYGIVSKSAVVDVTTFDWEGDKPLNIPMKNTIIYEMHVRGFTYHPSSKVNNPGTYLGVVEKIPYLKELGVTTIELLPVQEFNDEENTKINPVTGERLKQFWGYSTLAFFSPDSWYATKKDGLAAVFEFKEMVKQLHKAGIEVIIDVVYNHSGEGNEFGPTVSFRGLDNSIYYMLDRGRYYKNYSGCGNTLNCNHPVVRQMIMDSLRYWVIDMHVDGFRFDLAAILGRDDKGNWVPNHSILSDISHDPILSNTKIIAEGWDA
ncbi:MAG TPA: alpha-amylase family glycosyl hydrolase, partial [Spirochaetota bacterium]|nr:alpha-amylase family glycosyl hydrolase [Spirochaetota bacterium]